MGVPECPLVVDSAIEAVDKTTKAMKVLSSVGALDDVEKSKASRAIRSGKGKMRNRRYVQRRGPLVVFSENAFGKLDALYGGKNGSLSTEKKGYRLPRAIMTNSDLPRIINSDEVQAKVVPAKLSETAVQKKRIKKNPLKNLGTMIKLNPYAKKLKYEGAAASKAKSSKTKVKRTAAQKAASKAFFEALSA